MKKGLLFLALILVACLSTASLSYAETQFDLSNMTYDELVALKDQINIAIWNSDEWQEVEVPQGVWLVGEDIPVGHWTISNAGGAPTWVYLGTALDGSGHNIDTWRSDFYFGEHVVNPQASYFNPQTSKARIDVDLKEGTYVIIDGSNAVFTPYSGKPSLGFK